MCTMSDAEKNMREARLARIKGEAAVWLVKQSGGFTPDEQDVFLEWLAADPDHADYYAKGKRLWKRLDILADWRPEHSTRPNPRLLDFVKPPKRMLVRAGWFAVGLAAAVALGLFLQNEAKPVRLANGEFARGYERHVLEDGSVIELNVGAQASVKFTARARQITLSSGEACFTVTKDAKRPFVVSAGDIAVRAVGTVFNVQLNTRSVDVLVREGRVDLVPKAAKEAGPNAPEFKKELSAGQRSVVGPHAAISASKVETLSESQIAKELSWLNQVLDFNNTPLEDIIKEFNRRNYRKLVITDPTIARTPFSVTIRSSNIDDFVKILELTSNIHTEVVDESTIQLSSKR